MAWTTPTLSDVRGQVRDFITARLASGAMIANSVLRVIADAMGGLAHLVLLYIDWLSRQFLPDTAEAEWLDRHAQIWIGGRKAASFAYGTISALGVVGTVVPVGTQVSVAVSGQSTPIQFETTEQRTLGATATTIPVQALTPGAVGNLDPGTMVSFASAVSGLEASASVIALSGGADEETDDELRGRVLDRIRKPPMGGDADDYVAWALEVPGVTRAWASPLEMGVGTVTLRFMMDDLRADNAGFPLPGDVAAVQAHVDAKRPVAVKDFFVAAPIPEPIDFTLSNLDSDDASTRANIATSVRAMLADRAAPARAVNGVAIDAQTIYVAWVNAAVLAATGVESFDLDMDDYMMPSKGHLAVLGTVSLG